MISIPKKDTQKAKDILRALLQFKSTENGKIILSWLASEKTRLQNLNDKEDEQHKFRQRQGVNQTLNKFLEITEASREKLNKLTEK